MFFSKTSDAVLIFKNAYQKGTPGVKPP